MQDRPRLVSVNVAREGTLQIGGRTVRSGIFKEPAPGRIALGRLGLAGDFQADLTVHGGPERAVYAFSSEHYPYFRETLGRADLSPGFFGENFTTEGLTEDLVRVGAIYRVGTAVVQVTDPRSPCFKLGARVGSQRFIQEFLESRRLGVYLSVLEEGEVGAGDTVRQLAALPDAPTVAALIDHLYFAGAAPSP